MRICFLPEQAGRIGPLELFQVGAKTAARKFPLPVSVVSRPAKWSAPVAHVQWMF